MTLSEIKAAVESGQVVRWASNAYSVIKGRDGSFLIRCDHNDHCIGLTWRDGTTLNGNPEEFYLEISP